MQTHANYRVLTICVPLGTCIYHSLYTCICIIMIQTLNIIDRHVRLLLLLCRKLWFLIIPISPSSVANTGPILDSFTQVNTTCSIIKIILLYCIWIVYICWTEFWNHAWSSRGIKILFKSCGKLKKKLNHRRRGLNPRPPDTIIVSTTVRVWRSTDWATPASNLSPLGWEGSDDRCLSFVPRVRGWMLPILCVYVNCLFF